MPVSEQAGLKKILFFHVCEKFYLHGKSIIWALKLCITVLATKEENLYNITKQLHQIQESYLEIDKDLEILKLENRSLLKEIDSVLKNNVDLETFCKEQSIEIERAITLINNYFKIK